MSTPTDIEAAYQEGFEDGVLSAQSEIAGYQVLMLTPVGARWSREAFGLDEAYQICKGHPQALDKIRPVYAGEGIRVTKGSPDDA